MHAPFKITATEFAISFALLARLQASPVWLERITNAPLDPREQYTMHIAHHAMWLCLLLTQVANYSWAVSEALVRTPFKPIETNDRDRCVCVCVDETTCGHKSCKQIAWFNRKLIINTIQIPIAAKTKIRWSRQEIYFVLANSYTSSKTIHRDCVCELTCKKCRVYTNCWAFECDDFGGSPDKRLDLYSLFVSVCICCFGNEAYNNTNRSVLRALELFGPELA